MIPVGSEPPGADRTRLYLARHGEVVNHGVYNGHNDVDITAAGIQQMERLRDLLKEKNLAAVYASDLLRARKGAEIIARPHSLLPQIFSEFREMHFGRWEGLTFSEVMERYPSDIPQWTAGLATFQVPGGESMIDMRDRAMPKLKELIESHRGQEIVLVCHGALNRVILGEALRLDLAHLLHMEQEYGCLNIIEYTPSWTIVKLMNG